MKLKEVVIRDSSNDKISIVSTNAKDPQESLREGCEIIKKEEVESGERISRLF